MRKSFNTICRIFLVSDVSHWPSVQSNYFTVIQFIFCWSVGLTSVWLFFSLVLNIRITFTDQPSREFSHLHNALGESPECGKMGCQFMSFLPLFVLAMIRINMLKRSMTSITSWSILLRNCTPFNSSRSQLTTNSQVLSIALLKIAVIYNGWNSFIVLFFS